MLTIVIKFKDSKITEKTELNWYVGQGLIDTYYIKLLEDGVKEVVCVQADGDELDYITRNFKNIRQASKPVVKWTGEDALFIVNNL